MHRITGIIISIGALLIAWWLWSIAIGNESYQQIHSFLNSMIGQIFMFIWTACMSYHLLNGIRHLVWDAGYGFELDQAYLSGKLVLIFTGIITLAVWIL